MPKIRKANLWHITVAFCSLIAGVRGCASPIVLIDEATGMSLLPCEHEATGMSLLPWEREATGMSLLPSEREATGM